MGTSRNVYSAVFTGVICAALGACSQESTTNEREADRESLVRLVEEALGEDLSVAEVKAAYEALDEAGRDAVAEIVKERILLTVSGVQPARKAADALLLSSGAPSWSESVENTAAFAAPPSRVFGSSYYLDGGCDEDPKDEEYVFRYLLPLSSPSALRWSTTSARVYLIFKAAYGGSLLGFGTSYDEVRLCIGDRGVLFAGGPERVQSTVFVHE